MQVGLSGLVTDTVEYRSEYVHPEHTFWKELVVPVLTTMNRTQLAKQPGFDRRTIQQQLAGHHPHSSNEVVLTRLAVEHARTELAKQGQPIPGDPMGILQRFAQWAGADDRVDFR